MKKVVTLGEIMLRLSTPGFLRIEAANEFEINYGGGEANVCVSLANYGFKPYFVSKLPKNALGNAAVKSLRSYGVQTDYIARGGDRIGIYFLETGASMRPSQVVYDRAHSAIAEAKEEDFDFDAIFKDAEWFHFSGITPALSESAADLTKKALIAAKKHGVTVSVDLNFRKKLWTSERAQEVMVPLMEYVDVCIGNEEDAEKVLGFKPTNTDIHAGKLDVEGYKVLLKELQETFNFKYVATTLRESYSASDNGWSAIMFDGNEFNLSKKYDVRLVDRVGGGDSFAGGLIYGLMTYEHPQQAIEFAVAASALKQTIPGDVNQVNVSEVELLMNGDASGRVQR